MASLTETKQLFPSNRAFIFFVSTTFLLLINRVATQQRIELSYDLEEETTSGHVIGDVVSGAHLYQFYTDDVLQSLEYVFLSQTSPFLPYFEVDRETGVLRVARPIDRDTICAVDKEEKCGGNEEDESAVARE